VAGSSVTKFGFQGSWTDGTGLLFLINRYYDPATAQFLSIDPDVATTGQPYSYTGDDPLNATDPMGLQLRTCWVGCRSRPYTIYKKTSKSFGHFRDAELYVASRHPNSKSPEQYTLPSGKTRNVDVWAPGPPTTAIEVKTGSQALSGRIQQQIANDQTIAATGVIVEWNFYPNGSGNTKPSGPLLNALADAGIPTYVFQYQPPQAPQTPCGTEAMGNVTQGTFAMGCAPSPSDYGKITGGYVGPP
jgi:RHS repeat-associated protein